MNLLRIGKSLHRVTLAGIVALTPAVVNAQAEKPQYGGTLNVGTVYLTSRWLICSCSPGRPGPSNSTA